MLSAFYTKRQINEHNYCPLHDSSLTCFSIPSEIEIFYFLTLARNFENAGNYLQHVFPQMYSCCRQSTAIVNHINISDIESLQFKVDYAYRDLSSTKTPYSAHSSFLCKPYISDHFVLSHSDVNHNHMNERNRNSLINEFLLLQHDLLQEKVKLTHRNPCHGDLRLKITLIVKMQNECDREFDFVLKLYDNHEDDD